MNQAPQRGKGSLNKGTTGETAGAPEPVILWSNPAKICGRGLKLFLGEKHQLGEFLAVHEGDGGLDGLQAVDGIAGEAGRQGFRSGEMVHQLAVGGGDPDQGAGLQLQGLGRAHQLAELPGET